MRIKKIRAKNFSEALSLVRKEMGPDAVILSSEDKKGVRSYVEVTAAIDYDLEAAEEEFQAITEIPVSAATAGDAREKNVAEPVSSELMHLKKDIENLRTYIESMKNSGYELSMSEERKRIFSFLKGRSIKEEYALKLVERVNTIEDIERVMTDDLSLSWAAGNPLSNSSAVLAGKNIRVKMLIGPTGTGKTTTIAKLASGAIKEGKKVAMISIDTYKIGAAEQIRIYSRMIGIPLDIVASRESFEKSIEKFSDRDLILVDTSGQNPKEAAYLNSLNAIYDTGVPLETQLLLSASSDCDFLMETHKYYRTLPIDCIAFTKTDEAVKLGSIYNLCRLYQKPVAYITTGQRVPGNIEFVDNKKLTNIILRTGSA